MWIATDNGVSRFDGKFFQNFTIKNGLPSNDVLQVLKDKTGTVYLNCYKELPSYFDRLNSRFLAMDNNLFLSNISKYLLLTTSLSNGGIMFYNKTGAVVYENKKMVNSTSNKDKSYGLIFIKNHKNGFNIKDYPFIEKDKSYKSKISILQNERTVDSFILPTSIDSYKSSIINDNQFYQFNTGKSILRITLNGINPISYTTDFINIPEEIIWYKIFDQQICIIGKSGTIYIIDKKRLIITNTVTTGLAINCAYIDKHHNLWIGTLDKGLIYYSANGTRHLNIPQNLINNNFLSLAINENGELFAGNYYGQILYSNGKLFKKYDVLNIQKSNFWLRKTIYINNKIITITENGIGIGIEKNNTVLIKNTQKAVFKTGIVLNDSIVILGTISGLVKLDVNTFKTTALNSLPERTPCLVKASENTVYYIGPQGLYKYNYQKDSSYNIALNKEIQKENFSALAFGQDSTLWLSETSGNVLILKNDKTIATIKGNGSLPENITCMVAHKNRIWIGSKSGISVIEYKYDETGFNYSTWNISKSDGLLSNTVNDLTAYKDTIYAATENGISIISSNYPHPKFEISPQLISVKINQIEFPISNNYTLESHENNIAIVLSGVELSGHFKTIQYAINNKNNWTDLIGNTLNIQLNSGDNIIDVRGIDINNKVSSNVLIIHFNIKTVFYKTAWFWCLMAILLTAMVFRFYNRNKLAKQKRVFQQQLALEKQRNKITADLHDDIGASLSSLQLNSAVANQLITKNPAQAILLLDKIEIQSKNLADKIGDIIWSMKPGKDEFMTMSSRIKNFVNDILGASNINYHIQVDKEIDIAIKDITARKNIVLITKEAINNAVKYSKASQVSIQLRMIQNAIILIIADNGIGFNHKEIIGNGITNMKKRTEELNGTFTIVSSAETGTSITCAITFIP